jgi:hypothetical protein
MVVIWYMFFYDIRFFCVPCARAFYNLPIEFFFVTVYSEVTNFILAGVRRVSSFVENIDCRESTNEILRAILNCIMILATIQDIYSMSRPVRLWPLSLPRPSLYLSLRSMLLSRYSLLWYVKRD